MFCTHGGLPLDPANVRRSFRAVVSRAGLNDQVWKPRELRHSFVSLVSDAGVPWEDILRLVGHRSTTVTESVYRKQVRPVLTQGTEAMDRLSGRQTDLPTAPTIPPETDPQSSSQSSISPSERIDLPNEEAPDRRFRWSGAAWCWWAILGLNQ